MPLSKEADRLRKQRQRAADRDHLARWVKYPHKCKKCGRRLIYFSKGLFGGHRKACVPASDADRKANPCWPGDVREYKPRKRRKAAKATV